MRDATPTLGLRWTRTATIVAALACSTLSMRGVERPAEGGPSARKADTPYPADVRARIRKAIQRGLENLRADTVLEGAEHRTTPSDVHLDLRLAAATTWVLRRAGLKEDPAHRRALRVLTTHAARQVDVASFIVLALCAESLPNADPFLPDGGFAQPAPRTLAPADERLVQAAIALILERQITKPLADDDGEFDGSGGWAPFANVGLQFAQLEVSHLALTALGAAARTGIEVPSAAFHRGLLYLLRKQQSRGPVVTLQANVVRGGERIEWSESGQARGFDQEPNDRANGCDTAGGAAGLVLCQDALRQAEEFTPELRARTRAAIRDALAWLQQSYRASKNPVVGKPVEDAGPEDPLHDWRQAALRIGLHAQQRFLGTHDWYLEMTKPLLSAQKKDGSFSPLPTEHCAALLFLLRASAPSNTPALGEPEDVVEPK